MKDDKLFVKGNCYKITVLKSYSDSHRDVSFYTATIIDESKNFIEIRDRNNVNIKIRKLDIIEAKKIE